MARNICLLIGCVLFFNSCFKEDEMVEPHPKGDIESDTIALTQSYKNQVYYDLESASEVKSNVKTMSHIAFDCQSGSTQVILNTSCFMKAADLGIVSFGQPQDTTGIIWNFDKSDGNPDSTALLRWYSIEGTDTVSNGRVFAIDAGLDELGNHRGFYQLIIDSLTTGTFWFRYADLDGSWTASGSVTKDPDYNFLYFSFELESVQSLEPETDKWDLLFTQYTTMLYTDLGEPYPYLVTGVLLNRSGVEAALDTVTPFNDITLQSAMALSLTDQMDFIGYDWKYYDFETGSYTVDFSRSYIIRTQEGFYFKLRFAGFYNASGEKGYPVIEFQRL